MAFTWETVVQIIILILALRALHMVSASNSCSEVRRNFATKNIGPQRMVPYFTAEGKDLRVCPNGVLTCCTRQMEGRFQSAAKQDVMDKLRIKTSSLKFNFRSFAVKFQDDIVDTLSIAGNSTKETLKRSLRKKVDADRTRVALKELERLFRSLGLKSTATDVRKAFDRFANRLFLLLVDERFNTAQSDVPFEECVTKERSKIHPFMDVPTISAINLTTAIELARALHEGLAAGAEAVNVTESTRLSKHCQEALLKMQYCSHCWGLTLIRPCQGLCKNVLRGCLAGVSELDQYWNYYVTSLVDVTTRMRGTESKFNLEVALEDFENKLSSSLSAVFENMTSLRNTVEKRCKNARTLNRSKRTTDPESAEEDIEQDNKLKKPTRHGGGRRRHKVASKKGRAERYGVRRGFDEALMGLEEEDLHEIPTVKTERAIQPPHEVLIHPPMKRIWRESRRAGMRNIVDSKRKRSQLHNRILRFISTLNSTVDFYRHLPDNMCGPKGIGIEVSSEHTCWNGESIVEHYLNEVVPSGYGKQISNPEVKVLKVAKEVVNAIESLRQTTKILFTVSGQSEIPGILLHAPVYERRHDDREGIPKGEAPRYPCDDEDCEGDDGSGKDKEFDPAQSPKMPSVEYPVETDIVIILGANVRRNESEEVTINVEDESKCKGKGKKCRKADNDLRKEHDRPTTRGTPSTTSGVPGVFDLSSAIWALSLLLGAFLSHSIL